jgi:catechol 2,3-dioxygenase-like lactoylglutathione lyase family enzyme
MEAKLTAVTILTSDLKSSIDFYQDVLGMSIAIDNSDLDDLNRVIMHDGNITGSLLLCLQGPPFPPTMQSRYQRFGPHISHITYQVDDLGFWRGRLNEIDPKITLLPTNEEQNETFCFEDDTGIIICLVPESERTSISQSHQRITTENSNHFTLHHTSVLCQDNATKVGFYQEVLGMEPVYEIQADEITFMGDAILAEKQGYSGPMLEVMGQAGHWEREQTMMSRYGSCLDHLSFLVNDVDAAYEHLYAQGYQFEIQPTDYGIHRIAFLKDPNGIFIEIENPVWDDVAAKWRLNQQPVAGHST